MTILSARGSASALGPSPIPASLPFPGSAHPTWPGSKAVKFPRLPPTYPPPTPPAVHGCAGIRARSPLPLVHPEFLFISQNPAHTFLGKISLPHGTSPVVTPFFPAPSIAGVTRVLLLEPTRQ